MSEEIKKPYNPNVIKSNWYISSGTRGCGKTQNIIHQLQQENQQLKEQVDNCISNEMKQQLEISNLRQENQELKERLENASKNYTKYIQQRDNVLDEIRELVSHFSGGQLCECSKELGIEIEKILDKVKK